MQPSTLFILALTLSALSAQKLFKCFYYFPSGFAIYNLKDLFELE